MTGEIRGSPGTHVKEQVPGWSSLNMHACRMAEAFACTSLRLGGQV